MAAVRKARESEPANGPRMLRPRLLRDPGRYGITAADVPSHATIGRLIHEWGLAVKPVGPRDRRRHPGDAATAPGVLTIDTWGPWSVRAGTRLRVQVYLATIQDRFTRLVAAVPAGAVRYAEGSDEAKPGVTGGNGTVSLRSRRRPPLASAARPCRAGVGARAIAVAQRFLVEGRIHALYTDNGIGMVPSFGALPLAARYALSLGARLVYIPPAQPWHGRLRRRRARRRPCKLERFHGCMEPEYWRKARPTTLADAQEGLRNYLNYFNTERPHEGRDYRAPADDQPWFRPLPERYWEAVAVPERLASQPGIVEANRLVGNDGTVDTWGQTLRVSPLLGGPPTRGAGDRRETVPFRVRFDVTGKVCTGEAHYEQRKGQDIVVATFEHALDAAGEGGSAWQLYRNVRLVEFEAEPPQNEVLDEGQLAAQQSRVHKRRSLLERRR